MKTLKQSAIFLGVSIVLLILQITIHGLLNILLNIQDDPQTTVSSFSILIGLLGSCMLTVAVLIPVVRFAPWSFQKTVVLFFWIFFGVQTLLNFLEVLFFNSVLQISNNVLISMFLEGVLTSFIFAPFFVTCYFTGEDRVKKKSWALKDMWLQLLLAGVFVYPFIYFSFGFIVQTIPAHREYYATYLNGITQLSPVYLLLFQALRGIIWIMLLFPLTQLQFNQEKQKAFYAGILNAILMSAVLLIPNSHMPAINRYIHLIEICCSNFIWGYFVVRFCCKKVNTNMNTPFEEELSV